MGDEFEPSESARIFVGVPKGQQVNVKNAATLASMGSAKALSVPARMAQRISQLPRAPQLSASPDDGGALMGGAVGQAHYSTLAASARAEEWQENTTMSEQPPALVEKAQLHMAVGQNDGAEGAHAEGAHHLGILSKAMLEAGVAADGGIEKEFGSVMELAILSDGELTPVRRSKRIVDVADMGSLEKAEKKSCY